jgi:DNA-binding IclR family transcriptional regulator
MDRSRVDDAPSLSEPGPRESPPTERVIAVVNLLTAHPHKRFTLTDIIKQLDITKATCHVLLRSLTRAGYLVRHPDKTYTLGPALVAAGRVAQQSFSTLGAARPEMERLADDFDAVVSAAAIVGDELLVIERVGSADSTDHLAVGHRIPFMPPLGMPFVAWGDDDALEEWLSRSAKPASRGDVARWRELRTGLRERGYGVERMSETSGSVRRLIGELADEQLTPSVKQLLGRLIDEIGPSHYLPSDLDGNDKLPISVIYAPVLGETGVAEMSIALNLFREMSPRQIKRAGEAIAASGQRLSTVLGLNGAG